MELTFEKFQKQDTDNSSVWHDAIKNEGTIYEKLFSENEIVHYNESILPNGNILVCTSTCTGRSCRDSLFFGFHIFTWSGACDPAKDGYKKIIGNLYYKSGT